MRKDLVGITKPTTFASAFERETHYNKTTKLLTFEKVFNSTKSQTNLQKMLLSEDL